MKLNRDAPGVSHNHPNEFSTLPNDLEEDRIYCFLSLGRSSWKR